MPRSYSAKLIALTVGASLKWVDNLLSHHSLPGVSRGKQGVERQVTDEGLLAIEMTRMLTSELGVPLGRAAGIASTVLASHSESPPRFVTQSGIAVVFPRAAIELRLRGRVIEAVEGVGRVPRGRPPRERSRSD
jgi:hypothetical protein